MMRKKQFFRRSLLILVKVVFLFVLINSLYCPGYTFSKSYIKYNLNDNTFSRSGYIHESFNNTSYLDSANTTACGWGNGNISLPKRMPEIVARYTQFQKSQTIVVWGNYLISSNLTSIYVLNISNPYAPSFVTNSSLPSSAIEGVWAMEVNGYYLYAALSRVDFFVYDLSRLSESILPLVGNTTIPAMGTAWALCIEWPWAIVGGYSNGGNTLVIINITSPYAPVVTWVGNIGGHIYGMYFEGNLGYICVSNGSSSKLSIVDISNPYNFSTGSEISFITLGGSPDAVVVEGNKAYVVGSTK
ncbi:MAG: hypothetical protein QW728_01925, partial [Thermoplasmata archaeon]